MKYPLASLAGVCAAASALSAQTIEIRLREGSSGAPVAGAIVRLLRNDSVVAQTLTNELGSSRLTAGHAGTYRLRIDRIGFAGFLTGPFPLESETVFRTEVAIDSPPLRLPEVVVHGRRGPCDIGREQGAETAAVWDEVRKALTATALTQRDSAVPLLVRLFHREMGSTGKRLREWIFRSTITRGQPFVSLPPQHLMRVGFVYPEEDTVVFAAPDARLLLSDEFVSTHCFRAVPGTPSRVGLAFEPAPGRTMPDVSGTLWVNRATSELLELEFGYTGLTGVLSRTDLGGTVEFQRLASGRWIINNWRVRMPQLETFERYRANRALEPIARVAGLIERGGSATLAPEGVAADDRAILLGRVFDSTRAVALEGVIISVPGSAGVVAGGPNGSFELAVAISGPVLVRATHPRLLALRGLAEREIVLSLGDTTRIEFATPSVGSLVRRRCGRPGRRAGIVGLVWRTDSIPERNTEILASWRTPTGSVRSERTRSDEHGVYAFCDLPPDQPVMVRLQRGAIALAEAEVRLNWAEFQWLDLGNR